MAGDRSGGVLEIRSGRIQGIRDRDTWLFAGIPFAAPPTGPRRWRPPVAPDPWAGVRDCTAFGPIAPQAPGMVELTLAGEPTHQSEDCLNLNVWTPGLEGQRRPVMVWVHGGSFLSGSGSGILYRGARLAGEQDVVVVTFNYRLGLLGFLAHPALEDDGQPWLDGRPWQGVGNWGLADQIAALQWVQDNISSFGGDPDNVTLFGESAGGMSVATLLAAADARGLFHRAIVESGPPYTHPVDGASETTERIAAHLSVRPTRRDLEATSAADLVSGLGDFAASRSNDDSSGLLLRPVVGPRESLVPREPADAAAAGAASDRSLVIGTTRDESSFFMVGDERLRSLDDAGLRRWLRRLSPDEQAVADLVGAVTEARRARGEGTSPRELWVAIASDWVFRLPSVRFADGHAAAAAPGVLTCAYLFTWESPAFRGVLGSCHALDLPFVFGTLEHPAVQAFSGGGERAFGLSALMRASWGAFARSGSPEPVPSATEGPGRHGVLLGTRGPLHVDDTARSGDGLGGFGGRHLDPSLAADGPRWIPWDATSRPTTVLGPWPSDDRLIRVAQDPRHEELDAVAAAVGRVEERGDADDATLVRASPSTGPGSDPRGSGT